MAASQPSNGELRAAFEHVLLATRAWGKKRTPAVPGRIQELANARRLPGNWMATMRITLEANSDFRSAAGASADEESLGRIGWLWLTRPDGWAEELAARAASLDVEDEQVKDDRLARDRLAGTERRLSRAEREIGRLQSDNADLVADVSRLTQARDGAESRAREAEESLLAARGEASRLARLVVDLEKDVLARGRRGERLGSDLARAEKLVSRLQAEVGRYESELFVMETQLTDARSDAAACADEVAHLRRRAGETLERISGITAEALSALADPEEAGRGAEAAPVRSLGEARRRPVTLPPATFEDSVEAVDFLVRVPGVRLIVDGYNVALTSWSGSDLPVLRDKLVHALAELALRLRLGVTIFFDGEADGGRVPPPRAASRLMSIMFSDSETEADEEILRAAGSLDPVVPVVVATDDRAVQAGARRCGANVITVEQLLFALGRGST